MSKHFICGQNLVDLKLQSLTQIRAASDGWTKDFLDKQSKELWQLSYFGSEYHGGGQAVLKRLPLPSLHDLIDIAMLSEDTDDILGASRQLYENEMLNQVEFRHKLLDALREVTMSVLNTFELKRLKIIIDETALCDPLNRREVVGKHIEEIQKDAEYFQAISQEAMRILICSQQYCS